MNALFLDKMDERFVAGTSLDGIIARLHSPDLKALFKHGSVFLNGASRGDAFVVKDLVKDHTNKFTIRFQKFWHFLNISAPWRPGQCTQERLFQD